MSNPGISDSDALMEQLRQQQQEVAQLQRSVEALVIKGYSRSNEVTATVRGTGKVSEIAIDPELIRRYDAHDVGVIVTEAVNDALAKLAAATSARFAPLLENTPPLPA